jgi:methylation protein EvaC
MRFYAQRKAAHPHPISPSVHALREEERAKGLLDVKTYAGYGEKVAKTRSDLLAVLDGIKTGGQNVIGYGASGRATMIMNYCGIDGRYLDFVVDDAPAKHGYLTPGTHCPIKPWSEVDAMARKPDYALVFAWPFIEEVKKRRVDYLKQGGKFIVPLPEVKVLAA